MDVEVKVEGEERWGSFSINKVDNGNVLVMGGLEGETRENEVMVMTSSLLPL